MIKQAKLGNLGQIVDTSFYKHKSTFGTQAAFLAFFGLLFAASLALLSFISIALIWPIIPNFMDNAALTQSIVIGVFIFIMLIVVIFFIMWQGSFAIILYNFDRASILGILKGIAGSILPIMSIQLAQSFIMAPFLILFAIIAVFNMGSITIVMPILFATLFAIIIILRTLSFFAANMAINDGYRFFAAIRQSAVMVFRLGFGRIFALVGVKTILNLLLFAGIFLILLAIFGQVPSNIMDIVPILQNPLGIVAMAFLSYLLSVLIMPPMQILPSTILAADKLNLVSQPNIASRGLACIMDAIICGTIYLLFFNLLGAIFSQGYFDFLQMNVLAVIVAVLGFFATFTIYNTYFETFAQGQTPAKRVFSLVTHSNNGQPISFIQSLLRNILRLLDVICFIAIVFNKNHRRLGDILSLTMVSFRACGHTDGA